MLTECVVKLHRLFVTASTSTRLCLLLHFLIEFSHIFYTFRILEDPLISEKE